MARALDAHRPWGVINAAGVVRVDQAEGDPGLAFAVNTDGPVAFAALCAETGVRYCNISTDLVFDGETDRAYLEGDATAPLNVYGDSKARAEVAMPDALTVRTAAFFSANDPYNFAFNAHAKLAKGEALEAPASYRMTPTHVPDLADAVIDLVRDGVRGVRHLSHHEELSWDDFARRVARACRLDAGLVVSVEEARPNWRARRPVRSGLATQYDVRMPDLDAGLTAFAAGLS